MKRKSKQRKNENYCMEKLLKFRAINDSECFEYLGHLQIDLFLWKPIR